MAFSKPKAFERAERYAAKGQHDKAAREYQTIVDNDRKDVRAWLMLADCLVRCDDRPGAVQRYEHVAKHYVEAKETNKAIAVYRQVLNLDPQRLDIQTKVASLYLRLGNLQDGIAVYERIAQRQMQSKRVADALATYKLIADADPSAVARRLRLAELCSREKRTAEAVTAFRLAAEQLRKEGRLADYVRVAERLLYHDDSDLDTVRQLARVYIDLGDPRRALMKLNGLLRKNPQDEDGIELLAETFMGLGKPEKALSALEELARALREKGPEAKSETIRILRRGLQLRPAHAEFSTALAELEGRRTGAQTTVDIPSDVDDELGLETLDEDDLVELDDDDLVIEEPEVPGSYDQVSAVTTESPEPVTLPETASSAPGTRRTTELEPVPSAGPSLTQSVLSEVDGAVAEPEGLTDFDKILFEARVYIKYRLFEHALDHVQTALGQQPEHVGALSLQARAFTELERSDDAANAHVRVAQLVHASDPKLAREHVEAALGLVPDHPGALALSKETIAVPEPELDEQDTSPGVVLAEIGPEPQDEALLADEPLAVERLSGDDGDSGAFDLISAGESAMDLLIVDDEADAEDDDSIEIDVEPPANLVDAHDEGDTESTQPFLPAEADVDDELPPAQTGRTLTPFESPHPVGSPVPAHLLVASRDASFDDDDELDLPTEPIRPVRSRGMQYHPEEEALPTTIEDHEGEEATRPVSVPIAPASEPASDAASDSAPAAVVAPPGGWPDLSDDLAEVRFYLDQGLDDDAEAALDDLAQRHPGHPEIAAFRGQGVAQEPAAVLVEADAAEPLFDVDAAVDEPLVSFADDEDEDDYLSAIFAEPDEFAGKSGASRLPGAGAGANLAEGQQVDAATAFDLGVAYREMGLVDSAIEHFETAAANPQWRAKALTMLGSLRVHQGNTESAVAHLQEAVNLATNSDEASEAAYELGVLFEKLGDTQAAIEHLTRVAPGFRDRDDRLVALGG